MEFYPQREAMLRSDSHEQPSLFTEPPEPTEEATDDDGRDIHEGREYNTRTLQVLAEHHARS